MGKDKKEGRVKGNLQPSASSRLADMMGAVPSFSPAGLGMSSFGQPASDEFLNLDPDLKVILKKLSKKDSVTKVKALEELAGYLSAADAESLQPLLSTWPKLYGRLAIDVDRRVRELINSSHLVLVEKLKKQIAPSLKDLIGAWLGCQFDSHREVARLANLSFETAFPNRAKVLAFCQGNVIRYASEHILEQSPETLSDARFTEPEDMITKYARVVHESFSVLTVLFETLEQEELQKCNDQYTELLDSPKVWTMLSHDLPLIRKGAYVFLKALSSKRPDLVQERLETISSAFLGKVFGDKDASTRAELWDALIVFTKAFPDSWILASKKKPAVSKLYSFLKHNAHGYVAASYPSLLALLASLPAELLSGPESTFEKDFFESFWKGLGCETMEPSKSAIFVQAYFECALYYLVRTGNTSERPLDAQFISPIEACLLPTKYPEIQNKLLLADLSKYGAQFIARLATSSQISAPYFDKIAAWLQQVIESGLFESDSTRPPAVFEQFCEQSAQLLIDINEARSVAKGETTRLSTALDSLVFSVARQTFPRILPGPYLTGYAIFISDLSRGFSTELISHDETRAALIHFIDENVPALVQSQSHSMSHLLDLIVGYICTDNESPDLLRKHWDHLLASALSQAVSTNTRAELLDLILQKLLKVRNQIHFDLVNRGATEFVDMLSADLQSGSLCVCEYEKHGNQILAAVLKLGKDHSIVEHSSLERLKLAIAQSLRLAPRSALEAQSLLSCLRILDALAGEDADQLLESVFELATAHVLMIGVFDVAVFKIAPQSGALIDEFEAYMGLVEAAAQSCWGKIRTRLRSSSSTSVSEWVKRFMTHFQAALLDIAHHGKPSEYAAQIQELLLLASDLESSSLEQQVLDSAILSQEAWRRLHAPFALSDIALGIEKPVVIWSGVSPSGTGSTWQTDYDALGLTVYARVGEFATLLLEQVTWDRLSKSGREWLFVELLRLRNLEQDSDALGLSSLWSLQSEYDEHEYCDRIGALLCSAVSAAGPHGQNLWLSLDAEKGDAGSVSGPANTLRGVVKYCTESLKLDNATSYLCVLENVATEAVARHGDRVWIDETVSQTVRMLKEDAADKHAALAVLSGLAHGGIAPSDDISVFVIECSRNLSKIDRSQIATHEGRKCALSLLAAINILGEHILPSHEQQHDGAVITSSTANVLLKQFRRWYESASGDLAPVSQEAVAVHAQVTALVRLIVRLNCELDLNLRGFVAALCIHWIKQSAGSASLKVLLYHAVFLADELLRVSLKHPKEWVVVERVCAELRATTLDIYLSECRLPVGTIVTKPQSKLQGALGGLCSEISGSLVMKSQIFDPLCEVLYAQNDVAQIAAYSLLRPLIAQAIQEVSVKVEMRSSEDLGEQQLPASIIAALQHPTPKIELSAIESIHPSEATLMLGYLLSWMALFDHFEDAVRATMLEREAPADNSVASACERRHDNTQHTDDIRSPGNQPSMSDIPA
ncbi:uncharacterized protein BJ171DRAFT_501745 [Polychytrium aggregatum]|uniref:uncharacterized protein n=1 Tax=Polychytrium aggregatum TaxID=110093 RepID=UPI0022FE082C|nr:uncharacterized protein BJ171DRAFT_501745 [Polychytrium aggregatum]KAI9205309.1 hypothetical protein BJ171DRAFT_501745 [Polychytrium aggregatum]